MRSVLPAALILLAACGSDYRYTTTPDVPDVPVDDGSVVDEWDLAGMNVKADVIFYGDTSFSMTEELQTMGAEITSFVERLTTNAPDWHLMAVTGPTGCAQGGVLHPGIANWETRFANGILTKPTDDTQDEMGLQNTVEALRRSGSGCNAGFLRPDAQLHVIYISDENDESPGWETSTYWEDYVNQIVAIKGDPSLVRMSGVGGPVPNGCNGADPSFGYSDAALATGGEFVSICGDWASQLDDLADLSTSRDTFALSETPDLNTLVVTVDDVDRFGDWVYNPSTTSVQFVQHAPTGGQVVRISYIRL